MRRPEHYRHEAARMRELAAKVSLDSARARLLEFAEEYERLATQFEPAGQSPETT